MQSHPHMNSLSVFFPLWPRCSEGNVINYSADPFHQAGTMSLTTLGQAYHCWSNERPISLLASELHPDAEEYTTNIPEVLPYISMLI